MNGYISVIEAAKLAGVSRVAIYYHAKAGRLGATTETTPKGDRLVVSQKAVTAYAKTAKRR